MKSTNHHTGKLNVCTSLITAGVVMLATACTPMSNDSEKVKQQEIGSLTRTFDMVDKDKKRYGTVELDPVSGGKVYDSNGRMIGEIVSPTY